MTDETSFTLENSVRPDGAEERRALNDRAADLLPNDEVVVYTYSKERTLTVRERVEFDDYEYSVPLDWVSRSLGENETATILEGYGTEYVLFATQEQTDVSPRLMWPSNRGVYVCGLTVTRRNSEIQAEQTAADMLWRIDAHEGR